MARGAQKQAGQLFNESQGAFNTANANSDQLYKSLFPILTQEATNPQGYGAKDLAAMNTASQQSLGGATAGAVGEGNLEAARTRNSGGFAPALDEAARSGQRQLSQNALGIQGANANLKEKQRQAGIGGLGDLYGTNSKDLLASLGLGNEAVDTGLKAGQSGWFQNLLGYMNAAGNVGKAAAAAGG